tara:strand:+ start:282 stop:617 length:336 start_codon:yes stop_codon:yes gene_type:complete
MTTEDNTDAAIQRLFEVIASRRCGDADKSYTAKLFAGGTEKIAQKLGEEAIETVIAAVAGDRARLTAESADMIYHLLVLLADSGLTPDDVIAELERREGTSGIEEKVSRKD